jgi:arsenate reductase
MTTRILVLCTGNSCRSQMAEGWLRFFVGGRAEVYSAGIEAHGVHPRAVAAMKKAGIDISHHTSNHIDDYANISFDYVITVCDNAKERCPFFPATVLRFHHNFTDPAKATGTDGEIDALFATVRDEIRDYCREFASRNIPGRA